MPTEHFGRGSFRCELWIKNKKLFWRPIDVNVEFANVGAFEWIIANERGVIVKTLRHVNAHGGWTGLNFATLGLFGDYSIGFRNASPGERMIKQGDVELL